ncbi:MAG: hypothetical protein GF309_03600 [Candidatus Lokiarchaeota archaeon]|nr:hypothetical protein [Candidatus Lokiarchaeota archaeon]
MTQVERQLESKIDLILGVEIEATQKEEEILYALALAYAYDVDNNKKLAESGWRNKYKIHKLSGLPQKTIYSRTGPLISLLKKKLIQKRESPSRWGGQQFQYRFPLA